MASKLFHHILEGNEDFAIQLIDREPDAIAQVGEMGRTPLMEAAIFGRTRLVGHLLEKGANVDATDLRGWTALHFAAQTYSEVVVQLLLDFGADANAEDTHGNTPLHRALHNSKGRGDVIRLLLKYGAEKNKKNRSGVSPYDIAKRVTNFDLLKFFES